MKEMFIRLRLPRVGITVLTMFFFYTAAAAKDWHELNRMDDPELTEKIVEFQKRLDQNPDDYEMLTALGIAYHIKAKKDAKEYAPKAVDMLTRAYKMNKKDYETLCYLGSATAMMAQTTGDPMKKGSYANKGIAMMDKAIRKAPDNISVRLTRSFNSKNLPSFLNRGDIAIEDFEYLAGLIEKSPDISWPTMKIVYTNLAELYKKDGEKDKAEKYEKLAEGL